MDLLTLSSFDSSILGCPVGKVYLMTPLDTKKLDQEIKCLNAQIWFAFTTVHPKCIAYLEKRGFSLISIRSLYRCPVHSLRTIKTELAKPIAIANVLFGKPPKIDTFVELVQIVAQTSRYYKDPNIPHKLALEIYRRWFENSLFEGYADAVYVASDNHKPVGWLSVKFKNRTAVIDLIGILPEWQRKGIGEHLLKQAVLELPKNISQLDVVTEGENVAAIRFYSRLGFLVESVELVYHKHNRGMQ